MAHVVVGNTAFLEVANVEETEAVIHVAHQRLVLGRAELVHHLGDEIRRPANDERLEKLRSHNHD